MSIKFDVQVYAMIEMYHCECANLILILVMDSGVVMLFTDINIAKVYLDVKTRLKDRKTKQVIPIYAFNLLLFLRESCILGR